CQLRESVSVVIWNDLQIHLRVCEYQAKHLVALDRPLEPVTIHRSVRVAKPAVLVGADACPSLFFTEQEVKVCPCQKRCALVLVHKISWKGLETNGRQPEGHLPSPIGSAT